VTGRSLRSAARRAPPGGGSACGWRCTCQARDPRACLFRQERAHLSDRPGDGGPVDPEQQPQHRVRQIVPQVNQRGHQPISEHRLMTGAGTFGPLTDPASRSMATTLDPGLPRLGQLIDQASKMMPREPREQPMCQHRPSMITTVGSCHPSGMTPHPLSRTNSLDVTSSRYASRPWTGGRPRTSGFVRRPGPTSALDAASTGPRDVLVPPGPGRPGFPRGRCDMRHAASRPNDAG
jgi:hypothetical protein